MGQSEAAKRSVAGPGEGTSDADMVYEWSLDNGDLLISWDTAEATKDTCWIQVNPHDLEFSK